MEKQYRLMTTADIEGAIEIFTKLNAEAAQVSFAEILEQDVLLKELKDRNCYYYVATEEGRIISVFRGRRGEGNKNHAALLTIAIDPDYRGNHLAKPFTLYCLEQLKEQGVSLARAYVYSNNKPSINTLLSSGFTVSGSVFQHHYNEETNEYIDDIIFHKQLNF